MSISEYKGRSLDYSMDNPSEVDCIDAHEIFHSPSATSSMDALIRSIANKPGMMLLVLAGRKVAVS